jgi:hypothetical protein
MRAKFKCDSITEYGYGNKEAKLSAVYEDGSQENNQFAEATPSGNLTINIDKNAVAKDFLVAGKDYYIDFKEAE